LRHSSQRKKKRRKGEGIEMGVSVEKDTLSPGWFWSGRVREHARGGGDPRKGQG